MSSERDFLVKPATIGVDDEFPFDIDLFPLCAKRWRANEYFDLGEVIRPSEPNGFAAECDRAGTSGQFEPNWPGAENATKLDGSARWKMVPAAQLGLETVTNPTYTASPPGLTIHDLALVEGRKLVGYYESATAGEFVVRFGVLINGLQRYASQRVTAKQQ